MQQENQLRSYYKNNLSSREVVARDLPHPMPLFNEKKQSCFTEEVEDPRQKLSGMTNFFNNGNICPMLYSVQKHYGITSVGRGFTLIELLVVVLIIGILASVALPQYQKAVDKSRYSNLMAITNAIAEANDVYYLANGRYAANFDELSVDLPATSINDGLATFEWGYCYLVDQQEVQCTNNTTLKNQYIIQYPFSPRATHRAQAVCTAITQTAGSRFDKVCSSIGTHSHDDRCGPGLCRLYVIHKRQ